MSKLYIVATPIGNLEDITLRALRILGEVDIVACEDTRTTKKLLDRYKIKKPTISYHARSGHFKVEKLMGLLGDGKDIALVSDAGTPSVSDPGSVLVRKVREKLKDVSVIPIPGTSALTVALSASGVSADEFIFLGFLPHKKGREKLFNEIKESKRTIVFYESPHRIIKTIESLKEHLDPKRRIVVARELTKIFEEFIEGTPEDVLNVLSDSSEKRKGEFVVVVESTGKTG